MGVLRNGTAAAPGGGGDDPDGAGVTGLRLRRYIGQFEQAFRKPQLDISQRIDEVIQTDGIFERLCRKLIDDKRYADYFAQVVEFERTATDSPVLALPTDTWTHFLGLLK